MYLAYNLVTFFDWSFKNRQLHVSISKLKKNIRKKKIMTKHLKTLLEITPLYYNVLQMYVKMMLNSETVFKCFDDTL